MMNNNSMCKGYFPVRFYKVKNNFCKAEKCVCTNYKYTVTKQKERKNNGRYRVSN